MRRTAFALAAAAVVAACDGPIGGPSTLTSVATVVPAGGATRVDPHAPIVITFTHPMRPGMERYVALQEGDLTGPVVSGAWAWSPDRTRLTFTPAGPLKPQTRYALHLGGGMTDAEGNPLDYGPCIAQHGGQWATGQMMGGSMGGSTMMGPGWRHANGTFGIVFTFTTA